MSGDKKCFRPLVGILLLLITGSCEAAAFCPSVRGLAWTDPIVYTRSIPSDMATTVFPDGRLVEFAPTPAPQVTWYSSIFNTTAAKVTTYTPYLFYNSENTTRVLTLFDDHLMLEFHHTEALIVNFTGPVAMTYGTSDSFYGAFRQFPGPKHLVSLTTVTSGATTQDYINVYDTSYFHLVRQTPFSYLALTTITGFASPQNQYTGSQSVITERYAAFVFEGYWYERVNYAYFPHRAMEFHIYDLQNDVQPIKWGSSKIYSEIPGGPQVTCFAYLEDHYVAVGFSAQQLPEFLSGVVQIFDGNTQTLIATLRGHGNDVKAVALHGPGMFLSVSSDIANLWMVKTGCHVRKIAALVPTASRYQLLPLPGNQLALITDVRVDVVDAIRVLSTPPGYLLVNATLLLCPSGFYCPAANASVGVKCTENGTYCPTGSVAPIWCPAGAVCPDTASMISCGTDHFCLPGSTQYGTLQQSTIAPAVVGACIAALFACLMIVARAAGIRQLSADESSGKTKVVGSERWLLLYETWYYLFSTIGFVFLLWNFVFLMRQHCDEAPELFTDIEDASAYESWFRAYRQCSYTCGVSGCERQSVEGRGLLNTVKSNLNLVFIVLGCLNQGIKLLLFPIFSMNASCRRSRILPWITRNALTPSCLCCGSVRGMSNAFLQGTRYHHLKATWSDFLFQDVPQLVLGILYVIAEGQPPSWSIAMVMAASVVGATIFVLDLELWLRFCCIRGCFHHRRKGTDPTHSDVSAKTDANAEDAAVSQKERDRLRHRAAAKFYQEAVAQLKSQKDSLERIRLEKAAIEHAKVGNKSKKH